MSGAAPGLAGVRTGAAGVEPGPRVRGRPRDPAVDAAILDAAVGLIRERGYAGTSIETVATHAGVGKATIYRRYGGKAELVGAALGKLRDDGGRPPTGDPRADLADLLRRVRAAVEEAGMTMVGTLMAAEHENPELLEQFRAHAVGPGRDQARAILERARDEGRLREGADTELAIDMLVGPLFARKVAGVRFPRDWVDRVVEALWRSIAREPGEDRSR